MDLTEIRDLIGTATGLRVPTKHPDTPATRWVGELEDHILAIAHMRGELEEARLVMEGVVEGYTDQWEEIEGWEMVAGSRPSKEDVFAAKRKLRPDLAAILREAERTLAKIDRQIRRLELDERTVSRAYSMATGG